MFVGQGENQEANGTWRKSVPISPIIQGQLNLNLNRKGQKARLFFADVRLTKIPCCDL